MVEMFSTCLLGRSGTNLSCYKFFEKVFPDILITVTAFHELMTSASLLVRLIQEDGVYSDRA